MDASIRFLETESKLELDKIEQWLKAPESTQNEYREHWVDEHTDLHATNDGQELFLRSLTLVALVSRLTHSLNKMAKYAERFSERKSRYGGKDRMDEFRRFWIEYNERFGIDFDQNRHELRSLKFCELCVTRLFMIEAK